MKTSLIIFASFISVAAFCQTKTFCDEAAIGELAEYLTIHNQGVDLHVMTGADGKTIGLTDSEDRIPDALINTKEILRGGKEKHTFLFANRQIEITMTTLAPNGMIACIEDSISDKLKK